MKRALNLERRVQRGIDERRTLLKNYEKDRHLKLESGARGGDYLVAADNLRVERSSRVLVERCSFRVAPGDRLAILGRNGSGKSTLLDVICGDLDAAGGTLVRRNSARFARAYQQPRWQSGSLRERLRSASIDESRFRQIMAVMGVAGDVLEHDIVRLSHGQRKKIDLARTFLAPSDLLVWDEPLNFIDVETREQIIRVISTDQPSMIFVEHDRHFVESVATAILDLDDEASL